MRGAGSDNESLFATATLAKLVSATGASCNENKCKRGRTAMSSPERDSRASIIASRR